MKAMGEMSRGEAGEQVCGSLSINLEASPVQ